MSRKSLTVISMVIVPLVFACDPESTPSGPMPVRSVPTHVHEVSPANLEGRVYRDTGDQTERVEGIDSIKALSRARCENRDSLLGGGCWVFSPGSNNQEGTAGTRHPLIAAGPFGNEYRCMYANDNEEGIRVVATAICLDVDGSRLNEPDEE